MIRSAVAFSLVAFTFSPLQAADEKKETKPIIPAKVELGRNVSFEKDIRDILDLNCVACHYEGGAESRFVVENVAGMLKGGKRGVGLVPGKPDESLIYLAAARAKAPHMPPLPNKVEASALTPRELGLLRQWIIEGAEADGMDMGTVVNWSPIPTGMQTTYAVSLSPWADLAAAGRANQISIFNVHTGTESKLLDPNLAAIKQNDQIMYPGGAAHRDFVHSLAFHPNGRMLASGGFRVVKLWQQPNNVQTMKAALAAVAIDNDVNVEKQLVVFGTQQNSILVRSLTDGKEVKKLDGHGGPVNGVALTKDASAVVSGSADKSVRIWSLESGQVTRQIDTPARINDLCLSLDGAQIVTAHEDNIIRIWSFAAPEAEKKEGEAEAPVREIKGHGGPVTSIALVLPLGQQIISGSKDNTARIWTLANGAAVRSLNHGGPVVSVAARADGQVFASASINNVAKLWRVNGQQIAELRGHLPTQRAESTSKDQAELAKQLVALGDAAEKAADKNAKERADALKKAMEAKDKQIKAVEDQKKKFDEAKKKGDEAQAKVDAAQKLVDAAQKAVEEAQKKSDEAKKASDAKTDDEALKKTATDAAAALKAAQAELTKQQAELKKVTAAAKAPTDDLKKQTDELKKQEEALKSAGRSLELATKADVKAKTDLEAAKAAHETAKKHQAAEDEVFKKAQEATKAAEKSLTAVAFSVDGARVATSSEDGSIAVWASETGKPLELLTAGGPARTLAFTSDHHLLSAGDDQHAVVWDTNPAWNLVAQLGAAKDDPLSTMASPFVFRVLSLAFSPDGKFLATGGGDPSRSGEVLIWDVEKRELVREIEDAHSDTVFGLQFSRDGKKLVSGAADKFVKIHEVDTGKHVKSFEGHTHHVLDVSWKADGSKLVSAGADNAIKVWNVETGEQIRTITNYQKQVTSIQFVGVSDNTISCGGDKTVRFHTAQNGSNFRSFSGGTDFMYAADASRDQTIVIAGGQDGVIRIWNGANGQVLKTFEPPAAEEAKQANAG